MAQRIRNLVFIPLFSASYFLASPLFGQESTVEKEENKPETTYKVSFVGLGSLSDAVWIGSGKNQKVRAKDPNAQPPRAVVLKNEIPADKKEGKKSEEKNFTIPFWLNTATTRRELPSPTCRLYKKLNNTGELKLFFSCKFPEIPGNYSVLISRKGKASTWKSPRIKILKDDYRYFPQGATRIVNHSAKNLFVTLGKSKFGLKPSQFKVVRPKPNARPTRLSIFYMEKGKKFIVAQQRISFNPEKRQNLVCIDAYKKRRNVRLVRFSSALNETLIQDDKTAKK